MAELSKKQLEVLRSFYRDCVNKGIDPKKSEADKQRTALLADNNAQVKKILESAGIDASEAYRIGLESTEAKAKAEKEAAENAEKLKKRQEDGNKASVELELSKCIGRDKRMFFMKKRMDEAKAALKEAQSAMNDYVRRYEQAEKNQDSWGTMGGIAAGVTGSTAVGAAVAHDAMQRDAQRRLEQANTKQQLLNMWPGMSAWRDGAQKDVNDVQAEMDKVKLHLMENKALLCPFQPGHR